MNTENADADLIFELKPNSVQNLTVQKSYFFTGLRLIAFFRSRPRERFDDPSLSYFLRAPALITFFTSLDPITILRIWPQFWIIRFKNSCRMKMFLLCCAFKNILNRQNPLEKN